MMKQFVFIFMLASVCLGAVQTVHGWPDELMGPAIPGLIADVYQPGSTSLPEGMFF